MEIILLRGAKRFFGLDDKIVETVRGFERGRRRGRWWESKLPAVKSQAGSHVPEKASGWQSLAAHSFTEGDVAALEEMLVSQSEAEREMAGLILELRT
jgi:hypothetical protein